MPTGFDVPATPAAEVEMTEAVEWMTFAGGYQISTSSCRVLSPYFAEFHQNVLQ